MIKVPKKDGYCYKGFEKGWMQDSLFLQIEGLKSQNHAVQSEALKFIPNIITSLSFPRLCSEFLPYLSTAHLDEKGWGIILQELEKLPFESYNVQEVQQIITEVRFLGETENRSIRTSFVNFMSTVICNVATELQAEFARSILFDLALDEWAPLNTSAYLILERIADNFDDEELMDIIDSDEFAIFENLPENSNACAAYIKAATKCMPKVSNSLANDLLDQISDNITELPKQSLTSSIPFYVQYAHRFNEVESIFARKSGFKTLLKHEDRRVCCSAVNSLKSMFEGTNSDPNIVFRLLQSLLSRKEKEIRIAIAEQLPLIAKSKQLNTDDLTKFIDNLLEDTCYLVISSTTTALPLFIHLLDKKHIIDRLQILFGLCRQVKRAIIECLQPPNFTEEEIVQSLQSILVQCSSEDWRERASIAELAVQLKNNTCQEYSTLIRTLLFDDAVAVRDIVTDNLKGIEIDFLPICQELIQSQDYKLRQTAIRIIGAAGLVEKGKDILMAAVHDPVVNVRLAVAKIGKPQEIVQILKSENDPDIIEALSNTP